MSDQPIAPADEPYAHISKPAGEKTDEGHEGVHPAQVHPMQPSFPAPLGVDRSTLQDAGVDHHYLPGGSYGETQSEDDTQGE